MAWTGTEFHVIEEKIKYEKWEACGIRGKGNI
jgi:hypothetical protein